MPEVSRARRWGRLCIAGLAVWVLGAGCGDSSETAPGGDTVPVAAEGTAAAPPAVSAPVGSAPGSPPGASPGASQAALSSATAGAFTDITSAAGIAFTTRNGAAGEKLLPETMGGGVAFLDHDADGDADLVLVGGTAWSWDEQPPQNGAGSLALYENDGAGAFTDVTVAAGLRRQLHGMGPAVGDVDGDGDDDLYVTAVGPNVLFRNEGGFFVDGTEAAGVAGPTDAWSTAAGFFDAENDGDLDLLVGTYVRWSREIDVAGDRRLLGIPGRAYAPPMAFEGTQPLLFVNRGSGVFDEGAQAAGLYVEGSDGTPVGKTLAYLFTDLDGDQDTDVFVANDTTRNFLFVNDGLGQFTEAGLELGVAYDRMGRPTGAMGVDGGVLDDGRRALFVGNFAGEMSSAYVAPPTGDFFEDETAAVGIGRDTRDALTFGLLFLDVDLDGQRDLLQINGHLEPAIDSAPGGQSYAQAPQLFLGTAGDEAAQGGPWMVALPTDLLGDLGVTIPGRGVACADIDGDGDLDLAVTQVNGPARLLRNDMAGEAHWLRVVLKGRPGFPSAVGAEVELRAAGVTQRRRVDTVRGYLAASERTLTFGLGETAAVESVTVRWPDGVVSEVAAPPVDQLLTIVQPVGAADVQQQLNLAKAHLEAGRLGEALSTLQTAVALAPDSAPTWRNLARAHMAANDPRAALSALDRADALDPGNIAAAWIRAMALLRLDRAAEALPLLESVVRRDPALAAARFQLATALTALASGDAALGRTDEAPGRADEAMTQLREAVRLDAGHAAAHYQLAVASRRAGDMDGFRAANRDFLRVRALYGDTYNTPLALEACRYTEAEPAGQAVPTPTGRQPAPPTLQPQFVRATDELLGETPPAAAGVGILSMDERGRYVLLVARPDGVLVRLDPRDGGGFEEHEVARNLGDLSGLAGLAIGNYLDETPDTLVPGTVPPQRPDVFLFGPTTARLLQQQEDGGFRDVTQAAGLAGATGTRAQWVDHEHDGDLDLAVAGADGFRVFVNLGDGRFEVSADIPDLGVAATDVVSVDFDGNGAVDFAVTGDEHTALIENRQAGRFVRVPDPPGPWPAAHRVLADDLDLDGSPDAVLVSPEGVRFVFDGVPGALQTVDGLQPSLAVFIDPDGDGWLDLAVAGRDGAGTSRITLLRNAGRGAWPVWSSVDVPSAVRELIAADLDDDGDSDLLLRDADNRLHALRNDGGEAHPLLKLRLLSLMSPSGALGARVEVRQGGFYTSRIVQGEQPVEIGVGGRDALDSVLAVWPYGVVDTRTEVTIDPDGTPLAIIVLEKADTGSCPFLFVWDGTTYRFINDTVGSGATDLPASRGVLNPVNPHEIVTVGPVDDFPLVEGAWDVALTSELREVAYFDEVALQVVDHPIGTELASTHRMRGPPFPDNRVLCLGSRVPLRRALGSDGIDRTDALRERDGVHGPPGPILPPPLRGVCKPMTLEFDFGPLDVTRPLVFTLSGFIDFGTASTLIGQSQRSDVEILWPALEVRVGEGVWHPVDTVVGLPGGKARDLTMELDGLLPPGADRLRLTTTFQLHWDRAALFENVPLPAGSSSSSSSSMEVRPIAADLHWRGFSDLAVRAPGQPRRPDYDVVTQTPPWRVNLSGWCTRYGDVLPLLLEEDGKIVVLASGDELRLRLPAADLPPIPDGCQRTLMWRSVGYNKEADPNNAGAGQVWPLGPDTTYGRTDEEEDAWRLEWNTRWLPPDVFRPTAGGTR